MSGRNMFGRTMGVERHAGALHGLAGRPGTSALERIQQTALEDDAADRRHTTPRMLATAPRPAFDASCVSAHQEERRDPRELRGRGRVN